MTILYPLATTCYGLPLLRRWPSLIWILLISLASGYFSPCSFRIQLHIDLLEAPWSFAVHCVPTAWLHDAVFLYPLPLPFLLPNMHLHEHTHIRHHMANMDTFFRLSLKNTSSRKCFQYFLNKFSLPDSISQVILDLYITIAIFAHYKMCLSHWDVSFITAVQLCFFCFPANKAQCALRKYLLNEEMIKLLSLLISLLFLSLYPTRHTSFSILILHL